MASGSSKTPTGRPDPVGCSIQETADSRRVNLDENIEETPAKSGHGREPLTAKPISYIWGKQGFRDEFCNAMDFLYKKIHTKSWPYLAEEFDLNGDDIANFGIYDLASPSESMFQKLEVEKPDLTIKDLCDALRNAEAYEVLRIVESAIKAKKVLESTEISAMWDDAAQELGQIMLNLDRTGVWRDVAMSGFALTRKDCDSFERGNDPASNVTLNLFDILRTQRPDITVQVFKQKLKKINQNQLLKVLRELDISDNVLLNTLSANRVMEDIEHILNNPKDSSLLKLAKSFKEDGVDIDIKMFEYREIDANPTHNLIERVITRFPKEQTIKDLITKLININRRDCIDIIKKYSKDHQTEIEEICREFEDLQCSPGKYRKDPEGKED